MNAGLVVRISPADVGQRVSVRSRLPQAKGGLSMTDTVGRLLAWTDGMLHIERRNGERAEVAERDLLAGKVLAEPPPRRSAGYP